MGPAILLCPSSSAAHLWRQPLPSLKPKQKEGTMSMPPRFFASAGDLSGRPPFFLHSASPSEKCRKYFTWRRLSAAASASEVSTEEALVEEAVTVPDAGQTVVDAQQSGTDAEQISVADAEQSVPDAERSVADAEKSVADVEQTIADADESVVVEPAISSEVTSNEDDTPASSSDVTPTATEKTQARRAVSRSNSKKNIVVSPPELIPGAQFPGKVVSIQTFGAFVDFGAFTNGLAHISRLSKSYVKKVEDVVQVGEDVKVQILEVDFEANRISLMLVGEAEEEAQQEVDKEGGSLSDRASQQQTRAPRRDFQRRAPAQKNAGTSTLKKGEIVVGIVKNIIKSGVFLSLPDGTDAYLPVQEVLFKAPNTGLESQFQTGEEVTVRVLRVERGRLSLTMKREVNFDKLNEDVNKGVLGMATNPFELAFRRNEMIASYLAERDKQKVPAESVEEVKEEAAVGTD